MKRSRRRLHPSRVFPGGWQLEGHGDGRQEELSGAVQWPNGADLAPDAMYDAIRERGSWSLE